MVSLNKRMSSLLVPSVVLAGLVIGVVEGGPPAPREVEIRRIAPRSLEVGDDQGAGGGLAGVCDPVVVAHTGSDFQPGEYVAQGGLIEGEIIATAYEIPAEAFPIRVDLIETLFATSGAAVETTTIYFTWNGQRNC